MRIAAAVLVAAGLASGCATMGHDFDSTTLDWVRDGETGKNEILAKLGNPFRVGLEAGDQTWTYGYYRYSLFGESRTKDLVFRFDAAGKVKSWTLNTSFPEEKKALEPSLQPAP